MEPVGRAPQSSENRWESPDGVRFLDLWLSHSEEFILSDRSQNGLKGINPLPRRENPKIIPRNVENVLRGMRYNVVISHRPAFER